MKILIVVEVFHGKSQVSGKAAGWNMNDDPGRVTDALPVLSQVLKKICTQIVQEPDFTTVTLEFSPLTSP